MAKEDYDVADRTDVPKTALDRVNETVFETPDEENKTEAYAAGFRDAAYIGYETALDTLAAREDMESFDAYTRRTYGVTGATFAAGRHMRELPNRSGGNGYANDPANEIVVGPDTDNDGVADASDAAPTDPAVQ